MTTRPDRPADAVTLARAAMATRFEIVIPGSDGIRLRAAGEAALDEIDRLEAQLSFYRSTSELSAVNARAARAPVVIEPQFFDLLERAQRVHRLTEGAFDPTIAPLMRCWGFTGGGRLPDAEELRAAQTVTGMHLVQLDRASRTVRFTRPGVQLDLGAIGKGYAIERAVEVLTDLGVESALIHGGTSTAFAIGSPPQQSHWNIAIPQPVSEEQRAGTSPPPDGPPEPLAVVNLRDQAMSVSAVWGRAFQAGGRQYGHVLDPRLGRPVTGAVLAATVMSRATEADAFSTALLVLGSPGLDVLARAEPGAGLLVAEAEVGNQSPKVSVRGIRLQPRSG